MTFLVVLVPTLLMGSTLPLLTAHLVRRTGNVGRSLGRLYCVNTLGSALASLAAVLVLMRALGQHGVVMVAATLELRRRRGRAGALLRGTTASSMTLPLALLLSALSGLVALSSELLWYRTWSFAAQGTASAFGALLGFYLLGLAAGATPAAGCAASATWRPSAGSCAGSPSPSWRPACSASS